MHIYAHSCIHTYIDTGILEEYIIGMGNLHTIIVEQKYYAGCHNYCFHSIYCYSKLPTNMSNCF